MEIHLALRTKQTVRLVTGHRASLRPNRSGVTPSHGVTTASTPTAASSAVEDSTLFNQHQPSLRPNRSGVTPSDGVTTASTPTAASSAVEDSTLFNLALEELRAFHQSHTPASAPADVTTVTESVPGTMSPSSARVTPASPPAPPDTTESARAPAETTETTEKKRRRKCYHFSTWLDAPASAPHTSESAPPAVISSVSVPAPVTTEPSSTVPAQHKKRSRIKYHGGCSLPDNKKTCKKTSRPPVISSVSVPAPVTTETAPAPATAKPVRRKKKSLIRFYGGYPLNKTTSSRKKSKKTCKKKSSSARRSKTAVTSVSVGVDATSVTSSCDSNFDPPDEYEHVPLTVPRRKVRVRACYDWEGGHTTLHYPVKCQPLCTYKESTRLSVEFVNGHDRIPSASLPPTVTTPIEVAEYHLTRAHALHKMLIEVTTAYHISTGKMPLTDSSSS